MFIYPVFYNIAKLQVCKIIFHNFSRYVPCTYQSGTYLSVWNKGPFKCYVTLFSWKLDPHQPPRNANNIEPYTFVTLFFWKIVAWKIVDFATVA